MVQSVQYKRGAMMRLVFGALLGFMMGLAMAGLVFLAFGVRFGGQ